MRFDLILCDIDGCLAAESGGALNLADLGEVAAWNLRAADKRDRPPLTVCTGRPQPFAEAMCRLVHNNQAPCIAENGAWLYWPETNLYELDPSITRDHLHAVHEAAELLADRYSAQGVTQQPGKTAAVTLYHPEPELLQRIEPEVRGVLEERGLPLRVSMTWNYINCDLEHISKASGLSRLFERTGIAPERTLGIGDTGSDLPIMEAAGWFGCPANASGEIKARADYVSPHAETAGVLDILRRSLEL